MSDDMEELDVLRARLATSESARDLAETSLVKAHQHLSDVLCAAKVSDQRLAAIEKRLAQGGTATVAGQARAVDHQMQLCIAGILGVMAGIFPLPGISLIVAQCLARWTCANRVMCGTLAVLATPLQISLIPTFIDMGATLVGAEPLRFDASSFAHDFSGTLLSMRYGILGWAVAMLVVWVARAELLRCIAPTNVQVSSLQT